MNLQRFCTVPTLTRWNLQKLSTLVKLNCGCNKSGVKFATVTTQQLHSVSVKYALVGYILFFHILQGDL